MRAFIMRLGAVVTTALLAIGLLSVPAHAEPAMLSGTITSDATGEPVSGCVTVYDTDYTYISSPCTDDTGGWSLEVNAGVAYKLDVQAYDGTHLAEWAQDAASFEEAQAYTAPATVDVGLKAGGTLEGTLTKADGTPSAWSSVHIYDSAMTDGFPLAYTSTHESGEWSALVAPGEYIVEFNAWPGTQWAIGQQSAETATRFIVVANGTTRVDDQFLTAAKVRGTVVSDATGEPVEGACVGIIRPTNDPDWIESVGESCTASDGTFEVEVSVEGTYAAAISDPQGRFVGEFSGDARSVSDAATFEVNRETPAILDASLAPGSVITGRAVDAKTGAPIADACPQVHLGHSGAYVRDGVRECSGSDGRWSIRGLPAGEFAVAVDAYSEPRVYATTWAFKADSQATATLIPVSAGYTETVRDIQMVPGGSVTGLITGPTGEPVAEAWVRLDFGHPGRIGPGEGPHTSQTDENGRYTIHGVPPGDHTAFVYASSWESLAPEWSGDALTRADAATFRVKAWRTTTFDAQLAPASTVGITVVDPDGQPVDRYLTGFIFDAAGDGIGDFDSVLGAVHGPGSLPAGDFTLKLEDRETGEEYWYEGVTSDSGQTALTLGEGEHKAITFVIP